MEQSNTFKIIEGNAAYVEDEFNKVADQYMLIGSWVFDTQPEALHVLHLSLIKPRSNIARLPSGPQLVS